MKRNVKVDGWTCKYFVVRLYVSPWIKSSVYCLEDPSHDDIDMMKTSGLHSNESMHAHDIDITSHCGMLPLKLSALFMLHVHSLVDMISSM